MINLVLGIIRSPVRQTISRKGNTMKSFNVPVVVFCLAILVALFSLVVLAEENSNKKVDPVIKWITDGEVAKTGATNARGSLTSSTLRVRIEMRRGRLEEEKEFGLFADAPPKKGSNKREEMSLQRPIKGKQINEGFDYEKTKRAGSYKLFLREMDGDKIGKEVKPRSDWVNVK